MNFKRKLAAAWTKNNSILSVGLDPDIEKLPRSITKSKNPLFEFNKAVIEATADLVCAYKPNSAMYESYGAEGINQLKLTCDYLQANYPDIPVLLDFKRGDIGNTNNYYAKFAFEYLAVDAVTISPYMGKEANEAYLAHKDKGIFILCRTSNPGAGEFQDQKIGNKMLFEVVAKEVMTGWNYNSNCGLVVGSPYPNELSLLRNLVGDDVIFLVPGLGPQGGTIKETVLSSINSTKTGVIINSSRGVIYPGSGQDFADKIRSAAESVRDEINEYRLRV